MFCYIFLTLFFSLVFNLQQFGVDFLRTEYLSPCVYALAPGKRASTAGAGWRGERELAQRARASAAGAG